MANQVKKKPLLHLSFAKESWRKLDKQLLKNSYKLNSNKKMWKNEKKLQDMSESIIWKCDFINDSCNRKLKRLIKKYNLPINLVNKHAKYLKQSVSTPSRNSEHDKCDICRMTPNVMIDLSCKIFFVKFATNFISAKLAGPFIKGTANTNVA